MGSKDFCLILVNKFANTIQAIVPWSEHNISLAILRTPNDLKRHRVIFALVKYVVRPSTQMLNPIYVILVVLKNYSML